MKFLSFEQDGVPIAAIKSNSNRIKNKVIHLDDKARSINAFNELKLQGDDKFQLMPNPKIERSIHYVCGSSGSGKTYFIKLFLMEYKKAFPKNQIYIFSPFDDVDKSFEGVKVNYIKIDKDLQEDELDSKDFENSIVIFDDVEGIPNKPLKKEVERIMSDVLTKGRHYNVSACVVFHESCNGPQTKKILNESHTITVFPRTAGGRSLKYLFENYLGLDKDEFKRLKKLKTRPLTIVKGYPRIAISDKEILCLGCDDSDSETSSSDEMPIYETKKKIKKKY